MIALVLAMIKARRVQAVTLFLLAAISVAAAVAGPVAVRAVDAAVVRLEVANAAGRDRVISIVGFADPTSINANSLITTLTGYVDLPGFEVIRGGELTIFGPVTDLNDLMTQAGSRMVFRDGLCAHVVIVEGRCLAGGMEIIIGSHTAQRANLRPGDAVWLQALRYDNQGKAVPDGAPAAVTVVGVYDPVDDDEPYWGGQLYFPVSPNGFREEAIFISAGAMALVEHSVGVTYLDSLAPVKVLTQERIDGLPDEIATMMSRLDDVAGITVSTDLPDLADRVATSQALARKLGPVAFIPLAGVSLFVIYLAVAYGIFGRRTELALVALRGVSGPRRWVLATGESVVAILLAAPVGYVLGHLGVGLLARLRLGSTDGTELSVQAVPYAVVAVGAALAVALLGQRRSLREPVVELLRDVPRARNALATVAIEVLLGALAVVATLQLRSAREGLSGLGLLVPGLVVVAVALLAARLNIMITGRVARFALRRGLLGAGLAAVTLARRPGSLRLFALLAVGTGLLAFVAAGIDVAGRAREERASVQTGASRVLHVLGADPSRLLAATEALDPDRAWAMAAVVLGPSVSDPNRRPQLAVDTSRLESVPVWRAEYGADAATVAAALAPPEPDPLQLRGTTIEVDVDLVQTYDDRRFRPQPVTLYLEFMTPDGRRVPAPVSNLEVGSHTVTVDVSGCVDGCRLIGLSAPNLPTFVATLVLRGVRQLDPPADVIPIDVLADRRRWRASNDVNLVPTVDGLRVSLIPAEFGRSVARVGVVDAPLPVPTAVANDNRASWVTSLDDSELPSQRVVELEMLPRLGNQGVLVDLRSLERTLTGPPILGEGEIWLGPAAPADAIDQFRAFGLQIRSESTIVQSQAALARQGPALALHFHLAAATFGVLLAAAGLSLAAAVDRRARAADLRALRVQGLPRRVVRRAALWGYLSTVVLAAVTGLGAAAVAWATAGDRIPIFTDTASVLVPPRWPLWPAVARPWALATLGMVAVAVMAAWALRRAIARGNDSNR